MWSQSNPLFLVPGFHDGLPEDNILPSEESHLATPFQLFSKENMLGFGSYVYAQDSVKW
jgi:hypothetical protein